METQSFCDWLGIKPTTYGGNTMNTHSKLLYYHKTDGGAEYLSDAFVECPDGHKEGCFEGALYIVRIDGDITKGTELSGTAVNYHEALIRLVQYGLDHTSMGYLGYEWVKEASELLAKVKP